MTIEFSELVNKSPREARVFLGVSGKARESQYLGVWRVLHDLILGDLQRGQARSGTPAAVGGLFTSSQNI
ncbi:MAG: hypothetical protein ABFS45_09240 [Pseudomonadota bacterium]